MKYLPIGLDVRGRICIVVGAGPVGARKARRLAEAGAVVRVVAPEGITEIQDMADCGEVRWDRRPFVPVDLEGAFLVVAATDDPAVNDGIVADARRLGALFCDASSAHRTQVIFGALHQGVGATVAVFTDGEDPSRARRTRNRIAELEKDWGMDE